MFINTVARMIIDMIIKITSIPRPMYLSADKKFAGSKVIFDVSEKAMRAPSLLQWQGISIRSQWLS